MEQTCKYHPLEPATYTCVRCEIHCCDQCIDDSRYNPVPRCFNCNHALETSGPGNIEPFWRRLQQSFRYPFATQSLVFIVFMSVLCSVAFYLPFALFIYVLLFGTVFKYCLSCLSFTTDGFMKPPDVTEAYEGGFKKMLVLIAMLFLTGLLISLVDTYLGPAMGGVVALLVTLSFPAIIINYAISDSLLESLNPANTIHLVNSIGLPYGLILAFILIMSGSIAVLYQLVLWVPSSFDSVLLYAVTFYYLIVLHHLMGYMVFQYQGALGFSARLQDGSNKRRGSQAIAMAKISTRVKEAEFGAATLLFQDQLQINEDNMLLNSRFFEFLLATNNQSAISALFPKYVQLLDQQHRNDLISRNYKRLLMKFPEYEVTEPSMKLQLARACFEQNAPKSVIKLLHGIHKKHPGFNELIPAMSLLADALDEFPKYAAHAKACRQMVVNMGAKDNENLTP